jgi:ATP-dependent DNA helicase RecG
MRPSLLNPFFANAAAIKGIGPKIDKILQGFLHPPIDGKRQPVRIVDLLFHLPTGFIDRRQRPTVATLPSTGIVTVEVTVGAHRPPPRGNRRLPYRVETFDDTGKLALVYFHAFADHLARLLPIGEQRFVSGAVAWYQGTPQIVHPDHVVPPDEFERMPLIEPVYPLTAGLSLRVMSNAVRGAIARLPDLPEWIDPAFLSARAWPAFSAALREVHHPATPSDAGIDTPRRARLAYDELLANQLALVLVRRHLRKATGRSLAPAGKLREAIAGRLPFALTRSQQVAVAEIARDLASGNRMMRLLQGDVGSGKTVVALLALAAAVEAGAQGAFMAPTDILARQHFATLSRMAEGTTLRVAILTGREKGRQRDETLARVAAGDIGIVVGTHALFQEDVEFRDLALAVIDEQHRFGVHQRLALQAKMRTPVHLLVMTATPIPRTLSLTLYGDMDASRLTEKPAGRSPIDTRTMPADRLDELVDGLERAVAAGQRAYWVCPLVAESELVDMAAAEARLQHLAARMPGRVGLVHGRMKGSEKDAVMRDFQSGAVSVLVSTTVIEVGIDVPEASIMIIENAERFGLAQLHQLRGRVGRGTAKSTCILLYAPPLSGAARSRLEIMRETEDGFLIAEEDLRLRGAGEALGTRQSGMPVFRLADLGLHADLLAAARDDAQMILKRDPDLTGERGAALRLLLYMFERDEAVRLLASG